MIVLILSIISAYLIGSFPTAFIFVKYKQHIDIRKFGSGNVGATNALRILGKKIGTLVLLIDFFKGFLVVTLIAAPTYSFLESLSLSEINLSEEGLKAVLALVAVIGHIWPVYLKFKGGKGVATAYGSLLAMSPASAIIGIFIFVLIVKITHHVSLASITGVATIPWVIYLFKEPEQFFVFALFVAIIIFYTHRGNINRLLHGRERRTDERKAL